LVFPLSWIAYKMGMPAYTTYIIYAFIYFTLNWIRFVELKRLMNFPVMMFVNAVLWRITIVSAVAFAIPFAVHAMVNDGIVRFITVCVIGVLWTALCCFFLGLDKHERQFFTQKMICIKQKFLC